MVHVVSIDEVPTNEGSDSFQSNEVKGAQYSLFLLLFSSATCVQRMCIHERRVGSLTATSTASTRPRQGQVHSQH